MDCRFDSIGNEKLLGLPKVAFLASQRYTPEQLAKVRKWATDTAKTRQCVISGFKSHLESEAFNILIKGKNPLVMVLARGIYEELPYSYQVHVNSGRLLIITPFAQDQTDSRRDFAYICNHIVVEMADSVIVGAVTSGGQIEKILAESDKPYTML